MSRVFIDIVTKSGAYVKRADQDVMLKRSFENAGNVWHRNYRLRHFERGAFQRYRYTERSRIYTQRKKKRFGHTKPLVLTGTTRDRTANKNVAAKKNEVRVKMPANALNFRPRGFRGNMRDEFTQINSREHGILSSRMNNELVQRLKTYEKTGRVRIR